MQSSSPGRGSTTERNRREIAALRHEISGLLQTNGQLHQHLGQLNGFFSSPDNSAGIAGGEAVADCSVSADIPANAQSAPTAPASWGEERRSLEARASELTAKCRVLESTSAARKASTGCGSSEGLAMLLRERDDLHQRLHATELARCAAEQRRSTTEAALERTLEELDRQRKLAAVADTARESMGSEEARLRQQLKEAQGKLNQLDLTLAARSERVRVNEREYAEVRVEYDALVAANDALQRELATTRSRIATEQQGCRAAEQELHDLQAQLRSGEAEFGAEVESLSARRRSLETTLRDTSAALAASESEAAEARAQGLGLQAQLEVLQAARDEIIAQEHQASANQREEVAMLEVNAEKLAAEAADLSQKHAAVKASLQELQDVQEKRRLSHQKTPQELEEDAAAERARASAAERCRKAREEVAEAERRLGALLRRLGEERRQSLELARELAAAREAASSTAGLPLRRGRDDVHRARGSSTGSSSAKRRSSSAGVASSGKLLHPMEQTDSSSPGSWATSALRMHRELELLQRWKSEALSVMQNMQADIGSTQERYKEQLHHNQGLQSRLENMGQQARDTVAALGGVVQDLQGAQVMESSAVRPQMEDLSKNGALLPMSGPDEPERPDLPVQLRAAELLPGGLGGWPATQGSLN